MTPASFESLAPGLSAAFELLRIDGRLHLTARHHPRFKPLAANWADTALQRRIQDGRKALLPRAIGLHKQHDLRVLDATAGLGRDGYVLAALGARVTLAERQSLFAELLEDALDHARADPGLADCAARIELIRGDAFALLDGTRRWDVIHLDPMYPHDRRRALPGKEMQLLRELTGGDADADALLQPARRCANLRVIVKRPLHAPFLAGQTPSHQLSGKQARYDVYLPI